MRVIIQARSWRDTMEEAESVLSILLRGKAIMLRVNIFQRAGLKMPLVHHRCWELMSQARLRGTGISMLARVAPIIQFKLSCSWVELDSSIDLLSRQPTKGEEVLTRAPTSPRGSREMNCARDSLQLKTTATRMTVLICRSWEVRWCKLLHWDTQSTTSAGQD